MTSAPTLSPPDRAGALAAHTMPDSLSGTEANAVNMEISPGDDFFEHANAPWIAANPIPPQLDSIDNFTLLAERTGEQLRTLIEDMIGHDPAPGTNERRIVDAYTAFLDIGAMEDVGLTLARPYLRRIEQAPDLIALVGLSAEPGFPDLIALDVVSDPANPAANIVSVGPADLALPSRDYYLSKTERPRAIHAAYRDYLRVLLAGTGHPSPALAAERVFALEARIAALHWAAELRRDRVRGHRPITPDALADLAPAFPLARLLERRGLGTAPMVLAAQLAPSSEDGLPGVMRALAETPLPVLKAYVSAQFLNKHSALLGREIEIMRFDLYERLIRGRDRPPPRWKLAIAAVEAQIGELLGVHYAARHFPQDRKVLVEKLVGHLKAAMAENLARCSWLSGSTRREALAKLAAMDIQIGCSASAITYDGLAISPSDPLMNAVAAEKWRYDAAAARLGEPVDRREWPFLPQTVNASYREDRNQIIFPAAILQPPFFDPEADAATNYGALGAIIGHEIAHGFDDQGSKHDACGALREWWSTSDRSAFNEATRPLVDQYSGYCPLDEGQTCVNGKLTLGENIADLMGVELAFLAWRRSLAGTDAPVIGGLNGEQRFFLAFARLWRGAQREAALRHQLVTAPHPPRRFRVNGTVRNMDGWHDAFGVTPGSALYLRPEDRVRIW